MARVVAILLLFAALSAAVMTWLVYEGYISVPERDNPFLPLDVRAEPGPLTPWKFWRATHDPTRCMVALETSGLQFIPVADQTTPQGCDVAHAVRVERFAYASVNHAFLATCPLALALAMSERHVWQPAALSLYGEAIKRIDHIGSYACRNVNHAADGRLSEHAYANAIDVEAFYLAGGSRVTIANDWNADSRAGRLLARIHEGTCGYFHAVLGPDYNVLHRTHFHLDMGPYQVCQ
ncbi:extensin-like domain-containing protein [Paraburkholderia youngii]|nr:extensin family protein [Paraburkholderia youngii]